MNRHTGNGDIGASGPRLDAWDKAAGRTIYAADFYSSDMVWAGLKRSTTPHARIKSIETSAANSRPGVIAVLTASDVPGTNRTGLVRKDQPVLVEHTIRRQGDPVALVVAETREDLEEALGLIQLEVEALPGLHDPVAAASPEAPLVHENTTDNIMAEIKAVKGRGAEAVDLCPIVIEKTFYVQRQEHAYLETEAGWARRESDGRITMTVSTQSPHRDRMELAECFGCSPDDIQVKAPFLGGGFGGKDGMTVQPYLFLAAQFAGGRPVKMHWTREESFLAGVKRLPGELTFRLGAHRDGRLGALDCRILLDGGAYEHLGGEILGLCVEHAGGPYNIPDVYIHGRCVYTNNPPGGPFRGFGVPQAAAGMEQCMDMLASRLDMDPAALRRLNVLRRGDETPLGALLTHSCGASQCIERLEQHPLWRGRNAWKEKAGRFKRRGAGLACVWHGLGYGPMVADYANAGIELTADGRFRVDVGVADMGQGNASTYASIAAEILNQIPEAFELITPDTDVTAPCCSSAASRTTYTYGNALIKAARVMENRLKEKAAVSFLGAVAEDFALSPGKIRHLPSGRDVPLAALAERMSAAERSAAGYWRAPQARDQLRLEKRFAMGLPHSVFSYAAHAAFVEVDELTGQVEVLDYLAVTEAGRVLNRQAFDQQIQGGVAQGLGYALFEDYDVRDGRSSTPGFAAYVLPMSLDLPDIESEAVEIHETTGPFGMKGVGEIPLDAVLPAAANALTEACGTRPERSPFTPERVLAALTKSSKKGE